MDATKQGERIVQICVVRIDGGARELGDDGFDFGDRRKLREFHKGNLASDQIRVLNHWTAEEQLASGFVRRQRANRVAANGGVLVEQCRLMRVLVECADSFE